MWCEPTTFGWVLSGEVQSSDPLDGSSGHTSSPARTPLVSMASSSAAPSTRSPRAVFIRIESGFILARNSASTIPTVLSARGTWRLTTSAVPSSSSSSSTRRIPAARMRDSASDDRFALRRAVTLIPKATARSARAKPMSPNPMMASVLPRIPSALEYSFLFHRPARRSAVPTAMWRSMAMSRPMASSATAMAFWPGTFATYTPRFEAADLSMLSVPAPALTIMPNPGPAAIASAVTLVDRTTRTSMSSSARRPGIASASSEGSTATSWPASRSGWSKCSGSASAQRIFTLVS